MAIKVVPWCIFFRQLRMVDTYGALILTHLIVGLPIILTSGAVKQ